MVEREYASGDHLGPRHRTMIKMKNGGESFDQFIYHFSLTIHILQAPAAGGPTIPGQFPAKFWTEGPLALTAKLSAPSKSGTRDATL